MSFLPTTRRLGLDDRWPEHSSVVTDAALRALAGIIHTESKTRRDNTLGQLFQLWDVRLDPNCLGEYCPPATSIKVYVDGVEHPLAQAASIPLTDHKEIAIVIGSPPDRIPDKGDFSAA